MPNEASEFREGTYRVTWDPNGSELRRAHELRADVFCRELQWVGSPLDRVERDEFDQGATSIVVLDSRAEVAATVRLVPSERPWMLDGVFRDLIAERGELRRGQALEASRLAVAKSARAARLGNGRRISELLFKSAYVVCKLRRVRYLYMVTSDVVFRLMTLVGLPCVPLAPGKRMRDGVKAVPLLLDWERLDASDANREWYTAPLRAPCRGSAARGEPARPVGPAGELVGFGAAALRRAGAAAGSSQA